MSVYIPRKLRRQAYAEQKNKELHDMGLSVDIEWGGIGARTLFIHEDSFVEAIKEGGERAAVVLNGFKNEDICNDCFNLGFTYIVFIDKNVTQVIMRLKREKKPNQQEERIITCSGPLG